MLVHGCFAWHLYESSLRRWPRRARHSLITLSRSVYRSPRAQQEARARGRRPPAREPVASGRIEEAVVKAVVTGSDGVRLQVDFGRDETALVHAWQVREAD
jgi:hypothetical protein